MVGRPGKTLPVVKHPDPLRVVVVPGVHRPDQAEVVGDPAEVRHQLRELHAGTGRTLPEPERAGRQLVGVTRLEDLDLPAVASARRASEARACGRTGPSGWARRSGTAG